MISGARTPAARCTTSSARTSSTSTACSGRPCSPGRISARRRACTRTGSSRSTARRCRSRRGTFINASTYLEHLDPEYLRYYYAAKLKPNTDDIDINLDDFVQRVNSDLVGKIVNIASRCAGFLHRHFDSTLSATLHDEDLWNEVSAARAGLAERFEAGDTNRAVREIAALADRTNQYIDNHAPWQMVKQPGQEAVVHGVCSLGINLFRALVVYLKPILPRLAEKSEAFLNVPR